jgi:non-ribosomal peptide synthetase component F
MLAAYEHQSLPVAAIVEAARAPRLPDRLPLFQVSATFQSNEQLLVRLADCEIDLRYIPHGTSRYELSLNVTAEPEGLVLAFEFNSNLWDEESALHMLEEIESVLAAAAGAPEAPRKLLQR